MPHKPLKTGKKRPSGEYFELAEIRRQGSRAGRGSEEFELPVTSGRHSERSIGSENISVFSHWAWVSMIVNPANLTRVWQEIVRLLCLLLPQVI
jgi:hypothetical protein